MPLRPRFPLTGTTAVLLGFAFLAMGCEEQAPASGPAPTVRAPVAPEEPAARGHARALGEDSARWTEDPGVAPVEIQPNDQAPPDPVPVRGVVGSCDVTEREQRCYTFSGLGWTAAAAQARCSTDGGRFVSTPCPADDRIGECVFRADGDARVEIVSTFYAPLEPLIAEAICPGTFRPF